MICAAVPLHAAPETVWQIGTFDQSSAEFNPEKDASLGQARSEYSSAGRDPVFTVGKSDPRADWFAYQPAGKAGHRRHPYTIEFRLAGPMVGSYTLRLALLAYGRRLPWLEVSVNGHRGWFYQHPKLTYDAGDP